MYIYIYSIYIYIFGFTCFFGTELLVMFCFFKKVDRYYLALMLATLIGCVYHILHWFGLFVVSA